MASEDVLSANTTTTTTESTNVTSTTEAPTAVNGPQPSAHAGRASQHQAGKPQYHSRPKIQADSRKLFVGGVQRQTNQESFKAFFAEYGEVEEAFLISDKQNPTMHRGFGFITFKEQATTDRVLAEGTNGKLLLHGANVDFRIAVPPIIKAPHPLVGTTKLFCGGCPKENFTSDELTEYMKQFGAVKESWVSPKGFGFVTFEDINGCNKALIHGLKSEHTIKGHKLDVKWPRVKNKMMHGGQGQGPNRFNPYNQYRQPFYQPQAGFFGQQHGYNQYMAYQPPQGYQQQPQMYGYNQPQAAVPAQAAAKQPAYGQQQAAAPQAGAVAAKPGYGQQQPAYMANRGGQQPQNRYAPY